MFNKKESNPQSSPTRRFTDSSSRIETVIGSDVRIKGELTGKANIELRGTFDGTSDIDGLLVVRDGGKVTGEISATNVVVEGAIEGDITAAEKVELRPSARVTGDIQAGSIAIAAGSFFEGKVQMKEKEAVSFKEKRTPSVSQAKPASLKPSS